MTGGVVRPLARLHFQQIVPRLGRLVTGHESAYRYLPVSVDHFLSIDELSALLRRAGFHVVTVRRFMLGTVALHLAQRPALSSRG
jgi:demethylmenaquinone methyltransferase/2-methoxy-6-polyprenyl-1,4-benzoquinol methylase